VDAATKSVASEISPRCTSLPDGRLDVGGVLVEPGDVDGRGRAAVGEGAGLAEEVTGLVAGGTRRVAARPPSLAAAKVRTVPKRDEPDPDPRGD
jgi:hypothetical protein